MSKSNKSPKSKQSNLLNVLPKEFDRKRAEAIAEEIGVPSRIADAYLKTFVEQGLIIKQKHDLYNKHTS